MAGTRKILVIPAIPRLVVKCSKSRTPTLAVSHLNGASLDALRLQLHSTTLAVSYCDV